MFAYNYDYIRNRRQLSSVVSDMTTHTNGHMTVPDAMKYFRVSERTIRRWITDGQIEAEKVNGRWQIFRKGNDDRPPGQRDMTHDTTADMTSNMTSPAADVGRHEDDLRSEIQHLRDQLARSHDQLARSHDQLARRDDQIDALAHTLDQNQKLLAMQTQNNAQLTKQLNPPRKRRAGLKWFLRLT